MKSLVIGGTGQLGANLVRALLAQGHQVRVLHRPMSKTFTLKGLEIEQVVGDLNDGASLRRACEGMQVVYQAASYYPPSTIPVDVAKGQALKETTMLLEAIRATGVERLVFTSTLTTVGLPKHPGHPANETCAFSTRYTEQPVSYGQSWLWKIKFWNQRNREFLLWWSSRRNFLDPMIRSRRAGPISS